MSIMKKLFLVSVLQSIFFVKPVVSAESGTAELSVQESNIKVVKELVQRMFGERDLTAVDEYISKQYIQNDGVSENGSAALKGRFLGAVNAFPDFNHTLNKIWAMGDYVFVHVTVRGSNEKISIVSESVELLRLQDGLVMERWNVDVDMPPMPVVK